MGPDLLQPLNVVTELGVDLVRDDVQVLAFNNILSPVQEPSGDLELSGALHDGDDSLKLIGVQFSGSIRREENTQPLLSVSGSLLRPDARSELILTACSCQHRPSCRPSLRIVDRHP